MNEKDVVCIATMRRVRWALLQTGWPAEKMGLYELASAEGRLSIASARIVCEEARCPLAALFLPDPTRWQMVKAWWRGLRA